MPKAVAKRQEQTPYERRASMTWAQRLQRVLRIDIETCSHYGRAVKSIVCIEDPVVVQKILDHLAAKASAADTKQPESQAPPQAVLFR